MLKGGVLRIVVSARVLDELCAFDDDDCEDDDRERE